MPPSNTEIKYDLEGCFLGMVDGISWLGCRLCDLVNHWPPKLCRPDSDEGRDKDFNEDRLVDKISGNVAVSNVR